MTATVIAPPTRGRLSPARVLRTLVVNPGALPGAIILTALVAGAILAPVLAPFDYYATDTGPRLSPPTTANLLGTDPHGRDTFSPGPLRRSLLALGRHLHRALRRGPREPSSASSSDSPADGWMPSARVSST